MLARLSGTKKYDTLKISFVDSIYKNVSSKSSRMMSWRIGCCSHIVNINGSYIGVDKISHFFTHGNSYFERYNEADIKLSEEEKVNLAMNVGDEKEESPGLWGKNSTGVISFGDKDRHGHQ